MKGEGMSINDNKAYAIFLETGTNHDCGYFYDRIIGI